MEPCRLCHFHHLSLWFSGVFRCGKCFYFLENYSIDADPIYYTHSQSAQVNLNHMICPAILDPFQGANYRLNACIHQALLCPLVSKAFSLLFSPKTAESEEIDANHASDDNHKIITDINNSKIKVRSLQSMIYNDVDKKK